MSKQSDQDALEAEAKLLFASRRPGEDSGSLYSSQQAKPVKELVEPATKPQPNGGLRNVEDDVTEYLKRGKEDRSRLKTTAPTYKGELIDREPNKTTATVNRAVVVRRTRAAPLTDNKPDITEAANKAVEELPEPKPKLRKIFVVDPDGKKRLVPHIMPPDFHLVLE